MAYEFDPCAPIQSEVRRVARERLDDALAVIDDLRGASGDEIEEAVHQVRKRCKEVRALARMIRPSLGDQFDEFNCTIRDAAELLSPIRDAHAVLATFDDLRDASGSGDDTDLEQVRSTQAAAADRATRDIRDGDPRIRQAAQLLRLGRKQVKSWKIPDEFASLQAGLERTYRRGRRAHRVATRRPNDDNLHEWRKAVKTLWYHLRLLESTAPSILQPLIAEFDDLAETLGDDHDLAVLVERLRSDPKRFGGKRAAKSAARLARAQQDDLRQRAFRMGATLYVETPAAFADRMAGYWERTVRLGPELATGGIAELAADERDRSAEDSASVERERKFLVDAVPDLPDGTEIRQGYLAIDGSVSVRVRDASERTLTVKAGRGAVRSEFEWPISEADFEAAWDQTRGRRIHKTRHLLPIGSHRAEVDVFHDDLRGLVMVEVEFDSDEEMAAFEPLEWFGREVTDDVSYTNAALSVRAPHGPPPTD